MYHSGEDFVTKCTNAGGIRRHDGDDSNRFILNATSRMQPHETGFNFRLDAILGGSSSRALFSSSTATTTILERGANWSVELQIKVILENNRYNWRHNVLVPK